MGTLAESDDALQSRFLCMASSALACSKPISSRVSKSVDAMIGFVVAGQDLEFINCAGSRLILENVSDNSYHFFVNTAYNRN